MSAPTGTASGAAPSGGSPAPRPAKRRATFVLANFEKAVLPRIAARLPAWVLPDHLTLLGIVAATGIAVCYVLANDDPMWMGVACFGLFLHWLGDSLDGTLARVRRIERPRYGFYLDHLTDAYSTVAIGLGLGFSPYMLLSVGLTIVVGYLLLSINVYLETHVLGEFRYGYGVVGPTEARIALIALNLLALGFGPMPLHLFGVVMSPYDVIGGAVALVMLALLLRRVVRNLRHLGRAEPPNVVRS
jgi:phosphatidylglycerophosphate synthase